MNQIEMNLVDNGFQEILHGDCLQVMKCYDDNHFSSIVTDPPYGLKFMGKSWDHGVPGVEFWQEMLRIAKPGAFLLAFGGSRTYHRLICAIEDAGWEIRDCIMWIYGSGFPKSHNHFGIEGYGTALKPAYEPIIMAMKPCDGTFKQNAERWGQAGINIDGCRIPSSESWERDCTNQNMIVHALCDRKGVFKQSNNLGRWPANIILDEEAGALLDEKSGNLKSGHVKPLAKIKSNKIFGNYNQANINEFAPSVGGASRFFYCPKASTRERNEGLEGLPLQQAGIKNNSGRGFSESDPHKEIQYKNNHPTVKPLKLMEYLIKLVMPPKDGILLDPFAGSGSTILAAKNLGFSAVGIEKDEDYCKIARARIL